MGDLTPLLPGHEFGRLRRPLHWKACKGNANWSSILSDVTEMGTIVPKMVTTLSVGNVLFGKTRQAVLGLLLTHPDESFHLRQIVRLAGSGVGATQRELSMLVAAGILVREQRGRQVYFQVNRASPIFGELRGLVMKTSGLAEVLRTALEPLRKHIEVAFVFGSMARLEESKSSDVDLMIIGDVRLADVARALTGPMRQLSREVNPIIYPREELARKVASRHHFVTEVLTGPKIFLIGDDHDLAGLAEKRLDPSASNKPTRDRQVTRRG
jgi:predicted nucleotidyltransferase